MLLDALAATIEDLPETLQCLPMVVSYHIDQTDRAGACEQTAAAARSEAATATTADPVDLVSCMHSLGIATDPADTPDTAAIPTPTDDAADQKAEPCGATTSSGVCSNRVLPNTGQCHAGHTPAR